MEMRPTSRSGVLRRCVAGAALAAVLLVTQLGATPSSAEVVSPDTRVRVSPTTTFPYNNIVHIDIRNVGSCSGTLISRNTVATAAHCLFHPRTGARLSNSLYAVRAARNGSTLPYGTCTVRRSWHAPEFLPSGNPSYDYAWLKLSCAPYNVPAGLRMAQLSSGPVGLGVTIAGYPGDKPAGTMWRASGTIQRASTTRFGYYVDTKPGQSGAPILRLNTSNQWFIVGIHTEGYIFPGFNGMNSGVRFNPQVVARLNAGIAAA
jgi:glutamyl endopeptidase